MMGARARSTIYPMFILLLTSFWRLLNTICRHSLRLPRTRLSWKKWAKCFSQKIFRTASSLIHRARERAELSGCWRAMNTRWNSGRTRASRKFPNAVRRLTNYSCCFFISDSNYFSSYRSVDEQFAWLMNDAIRWGVVLTPFAPEE